MPGLWMSVAKETRLHAWAENGSLKTGHDPILFDTQVRFLHHRIFSELLSCIG